MGYFAKPYFASPYFGAAAAAGGHGSADTADAIRRRNDRRLADLRRRREAQDRQTDAARAVRNIKKLPETIKKRSPYPKALEVFEAALPRILPRLPPPIDFAERKARLVARFEELEREASKEVEEATSRLIAVDAEIANIDREAGEALMSLLMQDGYERVSDEDAAEALMMWMLRF